MGILFNLLEDLLGLGTVIGGAANDLIRGLDGDDLLRGNDGTDSLEGGADNDTLDGGNDSDTLNGGIGVDLMLGGNGSDFYIIDSVLDVVQELGDGIDTVLTNVSRSLEDNVENLTMLDGALNGVGNSLDNILTGNGLNNSLIGGLGLDTLIGGLGDDTMVGGDGNDFYIVDSLLDLLIEDGDGIDQVLSSVTYTLGDNLENLTLLDGALDAIGNILDNVLEGNGLANSLFGDLGADSLLGDDGNDTLNGSDGDDTLQGGDGDDLYVIDSLGDVIEETGSGLDTVLSSVDMTLGTNLENLTLLDGALNAVGNILGNNIIGNVLDNTILGNDGDDYMDGLGGNDDMDGGNGNDTVLGNDGDDTLNGGADTDSLIGGNGNDYYFVTGDADVFVEDSTVGSGRDWIIVAYAAGNMDLAAYLNIENAMLQDVAGATSIVGTVADNYLIGNGSSNTLNGGEGADSLDGGAGVDRLIGGSGNDIYWVDDYGDFVDDTDGSDTIISTVGISIDANVTSLPAGAGTGGVTVDGFANQDSFGVIENIILGGSAVAAIGNSLNNILVGNAVGNNIYAGQGNDTIDGGNGNDTLVGELGNDIISGQDESDLLFGNGGNDSLFGGLDNDSLVGGGGNDMQDGGTGQDDLRGNTGADTLMGGADDDLATGGFGADLLIGDGLDTLSAQGDNDILLGGAQNDTVYGGGGDDVISGGSQDDYLHGGAGNDTLSNTAGGLLLSGQDTLIGGAGDDTIILQITSWSRQIVSFDDVLVNGVIQGVDLVRNFQADEIDSSQTRTTYGNVQYTGPVQNLADQLDVSGLLSALGYVESAVVRQNAIEIRSTTETFGGFNLFELWVDADLNGSIDTLVARIQNVTNFNNPAQGVIDLTENIILL